MLTQKYVHTSFLKANKHAHKLEINAKRFEYNFDKK